MKLINVARASLKELREDYEDYLLSHRLTRWQKGHIRYSNLLKFCQQHNKLEEYQPFFNRWDDEEYQPFFNRWDDEEMANTALSLCHYVDKMMKSYESWLEQDFKENGGIRERMTAARLGYRNIQKATIEAKDREIARLKSEITRLQGEVEYLKELIKGKIID